MKQSRETLKRYFETGDTPTAQEFAQLIDSSLNGVDDGIVVDAKGRVGLQCSNPQSQVALAGNLTVGKDLCNTQAAPVNGLLAQGTVVTKTSLGLGVQTHAPATRANEGLLYVKEVKHRQLCLQQEAYLDISPHLDQLRTLSQGTISLWYKPLAPPSTNLTQTLIWIGDSASSNGPTFQWLLGPATGAFEDECLYFALHDGVQYYSAIVRRGEDFFTENRWYHLGLCVADGLLRMYIDGVEQTYTATGNGQPGFFSRLWQNTPPTHALLGKRVLPAGSDTFLSGYLDEVAAFEKPLSSKEMSAIHRMGRERDLRITYPHGLLLYWKMGEAQQFPNIPSQGKWSLAAEYVGPQAPSPITEYTQQVLMFKDPQGQEIPITQQAGPANAGSLWGRKGEHLYFDQGRVGIGTDSPTQALEVQGFVEKKHVAMAAIGKNHSSSGSDQLLAYQFSELVENCPWDGKTFTVPLAGIYYMSVGFTRNAYNKEGTADDIMLYIRVNQTKLRGRAWTGEGDGPRASSSFATMRKLNAGDTVDTITSSDGGYRRMLKDFYFNIYRL